MTTYIAAYNSSPEDKAAADYVCDGTNDEYEIQLGLNWIGRTRVYLFAGTYNLHNKLYLKYNKTLEGAGRGNARVIPGVWEKHSNEPLTLLKCFNSIIRVQENYCTLKNVRVEGHNTYNQEGLVYVTRGNFTMQNVYGWTTSSMQALFYIRTVKQEQNAILYNFLVEDCVADAPNTYGFIHSAYPAYHQTNEPNMKQQNVTYRDCLAYRCGMDGYFNQWVTGLNWSELNAVENLYVYDCVAYETLESGFHMERINNGHNSKKNCNFYRCKSIRSGMKPYSSVWGWGGENYFGCGFYVPQGQYYFEDCEAIDCSMFGWFSSYCYDVELKNCIVSGTGWGKTNYSVCKPMDYMFLQSYLDNPYGSGKSFKLVNCKSIDSNGRALYIGHVYDSVIQNMEIINPAGVDGVGALIGNEAGGHGNVQRINYEIKCTNAMRPTYAVIMFDGVGGTTASPSTYTGSIRSNISCPMRIAGSGTNNLRIQNHTVYSDTLPLGGTGICSSVESWRYTLTNCVVERPEGEEPEPDPDPEPPSGGIYRVAAANSPTEEKSISQWICNGTNDHTEIQAAINASQPGDTVQLMTGTFNVGATLIPKAGTTFRGMGQGAGGSILNMTGETQVRIMYSNVLLEDFRTTNTGYIYITHGGGSIVRRVTAYQLGNKRMSAFWVYPDNKTIDDLQFIECHAINCNRWGFTHNGTSNGIIRNVTYTDCSAIKCGYYGQYYGMYGQYSEAWDVGFNAAETVSYVENIHYVRCIAEDCWESGFHTEFLPGKVNVTYTDCESRNNGHSPTYWYGAGYMVSKDMHYSNCISENNRSGWFCYNGGSSVTGGEDTGSNIGVYIHGIGVAGLTINGTRFIGTTQPLYAISNSTRNVNLRNLFIDANGPRKNTHGFTIHASAYTANEMLLEYSYIKGYNYAVYNSATPKVKVRGNTIDDCSNTYYNCEILTDVTTIRVAASNSPQAKKDQAEYICNGIDDQNTINAAIDATPSGGATVLFEGTYNCSGHVNTGSNKALRGDGNTITFLQFTNNGRLNINNTTTTIQDFHVDGTGYSEAQKTTGIVAIRASGAKITRIRSTGNASSIACFHVISEPHVYDFPLTNIVFTECEAYNTGNTGFLHDSRPHGTLGYYHKQHSNITYNRCNARNCGFAGKGQYNAWVVGFNFANTNDIDDLLVEDCNAENTWESGFHLDFNVLKTNITFRRCVATRCGRKDWPTVPYQYEDPSTHYYGAGFYAQNGPGPINFYNCEAIECAKYGFWVDNGVRLYDCDCFDVGWNKTTNFHIHKPTSFFHNPSRSVNPSTILVRCRSIRAKSYALFMDNVRWATVEDFEAYNPQGVSDGVGIRIGGQQQHVVDSTFTFAQIEDTLNLNPLMVIGNNRSCQYTFGIVDTDSLQPVRIQDNMTTATYRTENLLIKDWTTYSNTLPVGAGGITLAPNVESWQVTFQNVTVVRRDEEPEPPENVIYVAADDSSSVDKQLAHYVCDSITDGDTINTALAFAENEKIGTVYLFDGNYLIGERNIAIPKDTALMGVGNNTKLHLIGASRVTCEGNNSNFESFYINANLAMNTNKTFGAVTIHGSDVIIKNIFITAGKDIAAAFCIRTPPGAQSSNISFINCIASETGCTGFLHARADQSSFDTHVNILYQSCQALYCGNAGKGQYEERVHGFSLANIDGGRLVNHITNLSVINCKSNNNWEAGFYAPSASMKTGCEMTDCEANDNGARPMPWLDEPHIDYEGSGFVLKNFSGTVLRGVARRNHRNGFYVTNGTQLVDCIEEDTGQQYSTGGYAPVGFIVYDSKIGNPSVEMIRCKSINSSMCGLYVEESKNIKITDMEIINPGGWSGSGAFFGEYALDDSTVSIKRAEDGYQLPTFITLGGNKNVVYTNCEITTESSNPIRIKGARTQNLHVRNTNIYSDAHPAKELSVGDSGITINEEVSVSEISFYNVWVKGSGEIPPEPEPPVGWLSDWKYRYELTIKSEYIDTTLDIPVSLRLHGTKWAPLFDLLGNNYLKIAIADESGVQRPIEITNWDATNKRGHIYFRAPNLSSTEDTTLYLYYDITKPDNNTYVGISGSGAAREVWDANYHGVWNARLDGSGRFIDSTAAGNAATKHTDVTQKFYTDGLVGMYIMLDKWVDLNFPVSTFNGYTKSTVEIFFEFNWMGDGWREHIFFGQHSPDSARLYLVARGYPSDRQFQFGIGNTPWRSNYSPVVNYDKWHVAFTIDKTNSTAKLYANNTLCETRPGYPSGGAWSWFNLDRTLRLGDCFYDFDPQTIYTSSICAFSVRISNVVRTPEYIKAVTASERNLLVTVGDIEEYAETTPDPVEPAAWLPGWKFRHEIAVRHQLVNLPLTQDHYNVPIRIELNSATGTGFSDMTNVFNIIGNDAQKIAFTDYYGKQLKVEIVFWNVQYKLAILYVRVPKLNKTGRTTLYFYYDPHQSLNTANVGYTGEAPANEIWDLHYKLAWNGGLDTTTWKLLDSTSNNNHGTLNNMTVYRDAKGQVIANTTGGAGNVDFGNAASLQNISNEISVECMFRIREYPPQPPPGQFRYCFPLTKGIPAFHTDGAWTIAIRETGEGHFFVRHPNNSTYDYTWLWTPQPLFTRINTFNTFKPYGLVRTIIDGNLNAQKTTNLPGLATNNGSVIVNNPYIHNAFNGDVFRIRIANKELTPEWAKIMDFSERDKLIYYHGAYQKFFVVGERSVTAYTKRIHGSAAGYLQRRQEKATSSFVRKITGSTTRIWIPAIPAPDLPDVVFPDKLMLEVRTSTGQLVAILENAIDVQYEEGINVPSRLSFGMPADDNKVQHITMVNEIWLRDHRTGQIVEKFKMQYQHDRRE